MPTLTATGVTFNGATVTVPGTVTPRIALPSSLLSKTQGWVALRVALPYASTTGAPGTSDVVAFAWPAATGDPNASNVYLAWRQTSGAWDARREDTSASLQLLASDSFSAAAHITIIYAWTATQIKVSIDGAAFSTQANSETGGASLLSSFALGTQIDNATNTAGSVALGGDIYWACGGSGTLTDTDAATIHGNGDTDPTWAALPGAPTFLWDAVDSSYLDASPSQDHPFINITVR